MKHWLLACGLLLAGIFCLSQQPRAYWQSRDSSYNNPAGGGGGGSYVGPGDVVSGAKVFWGLRSYNGAWANGTNVLANVLRASDSHTCDLLAATTGGLGNTVNCSTGGDNGQSAASFCNATTCTVGVLYDQSGGNQCNGTVCNLLMTTTAQQPTLVLSCLGSLPCLQGAGSQSIGQNSFSQRFNSGSLSLPYTLSVVAGRTANFTTISGLIAFDNASGNVNFWFPASTNAIFCDPTNGTGFNATASDNAMHSLFCAISATGTVIYVDGVSTAGLAGTQSPLWNNGGIASIMIAGSGSHFLQGNEFEAGVWPVQFTPTQATNVCHNQFAYWGTATSC